MRDPKADLRIACIVYTLKEVHGALAEGSARAWNTGSSEHQSTQQKRKLPLKLRLVQPSLLLLLVLLDAAGVCDI